VYLELLLRQIDYFSSIYSVVVAALIHPMIPLPSMYIMAVSVPRTIILWLIIAIFAFALITILGGCHHGDMVYDYLISRSFASRL